MFYRYQVCLTLALGLLGTGCGSTMRLNRVVLYQNGVGYFERSGRASGETLSLQLRAHEVDDVMKTLTVIGADGTAALSAVVPERQRPPVRPDGEEPAPIEDPDESTTLQVHLGQQSGPITVTYAVPTPSWGAVHRIVLPTEGDEALLQSWAVIHNASGEDWTDVHLTLTTGAPFTYAIDLRTPRFLARPDLTGELVTPLTYGAVRSTESRSESERSAPPPPPMPAPEPAPMIGGVLRDRSGGGAAPAAPRREMARAEADEGYSSGMDTAYAEAAPIVSVDAMDTRAMATASTETTTDATRYELDAPVTIPAGNSTLVAIVNERVPGSDILLFRPDAATPASQTHPFHAARLSNSSGLSLIQGPVALYARGTFVGEGVLNRLAEGENTTIPYAIDMSTEVVSTVEHDSQPHRLISIADGVAMIEEWTLRRTRYEVRAGARVPERAYVSHPRLDGFDFVDEPEGTETSGSTSLVPLAIEPGETRDMTIVERRAGRRRYAILNLASDYFVAFEGDELPPELRERFTELANLRRELGELEGRLRDVREQRMVQARRLSELQQSLSAIERSTSAGELRRQLQTHLREATQATERFTVQEADLTAQIAELGVRLREAVRALSYESPPEGTTPAQSATTPASQTTSPVAPAPR